MGDERLPDRSTSKPPPDIASGDEFATVTSGAAGVGPVDVLPGESLGDFDLLLRLGSGAFATVFLARQRSLQRLVALKVTATESEESLALAQMDHDYVVRVFDQGNVPARGLRYVYMQYVPGGTLQDVLRERQLSGKSRRGGEVVVRSIRRSMEGRGETPTCESTSVCELQRLNWPEVVCWMGSRLARGLAHAHRSGILHRDIKPANVLLTADGIPKLADFNVAFAGSVSGRDASEGFGGSLAYMSPEQLAVCDPAEDLKAEQLDGRSDVYSLGVLLFELLTGERPFDDSDIKQSGVALIRELKQRRRAGVVEAQWQRLAGVPRGLLRVLRRMLAPRPEDRWRDAKTVARELDCCLNERTETLRFPPPASLGRFLQPHLLWVVLVLAVIPNAVASVFNLAYNWRQIVEQLSDAGLAFWRVQTTINAIAFPLGIAVLLNICRKVTPVVHRPTKFPVEERLRAIAWVTGLGHFTALLSVVEWSLAGIAYPVSMHLAIGHLPISAYVHFLGSLVLSGLIAAAYPFMLISACAVRAWLPRLLNAGVESEQVRNAIALLRQRSWRYLVLSFLLPLLATGALVLIDVQDAFSLMALSVGGAAGALLNYRLFRVMHDDIDALECVLAARHAP